MKDNKENKNINIIVADERRMQAILHAEGMDDFYIPAGTLEYIDKIIERADHEGFHIPMPELFAKMVLGAVFVFDMDLSTWLRSGETAFLMDLVGIEMNADVRRFPYVDFGPDFRPRFARK